MLVSTAYFPNIFYLAICSVSDTIHIESCEHFVKQTYRNRTTIISANGSLDLIIPIIKNQGSKTYIKDITISYAEAWNKQHVHAIMSAYKSSPFFEFYFDDIISILLKKHKFLWDFNMSILVNILHKLQIESSIIETTDFLNPDIQNTTDFRYTISPKNEVQGINFEPYYQIFSSKYGFLSNMSCIDLICNIGPEAIIYLKNIGNKIC